MSTPDPGKAAKTDVPAPQTAEEQKIIDLVQAGLASGPPLPVDDEFFRRLLKRIQPER